MYNVSVSPKSRSMTDCASNNEEFRLQISGPGLDVDRMISGAIAAAVLATAMAPRPSDGREVNLSTLDACASAFPSTTSLREYLDEVGAKKKTDLIVAIGSFLLKIERQTDFSRDDIRARFSSAREPMPRNFSRDFNQTLKDALIAEVHQKPDYFYVTKTGMNAVENHFSK